MPRILLTLLLILGLGLVVPVGAHATTYGANVTGVFLNQTRGVWSTQRAERSLKDLHAAGGRVARSSSDWAATEPSRPVDGHHHFRWSYDDMVVSELAQAHLRWQPTLQSTPDWARPHRPDLVANAEGVLVPTPLPPARYANFGVYARAFTRRYGVHGVFWRHHRRLAYLPVRTFEVWNEPDEALSWGPHVDLQHYRNMYEVVRTAIHRVNRRAEVVSGGLAWTRSSLPRLLKAFRHRPLDAVAFHPYAANPRGTIALARYAIALIKKYGRGRTPLLANEYGWIPTSHTWGATNASSVDLYVYRGLLGLSKLHLADVLPFQWANLNWGLSDGTFGLAVRAIHARERAARQRRSSRDRRSRSRR